MKPRASLAILACAWALLACDSADKAAEESAAAQVPEEQQSQPQPQKAPDEPAAPEEVTEEAVPDGKDTASEPSKVLSDDAKAKIKELVGTWVSSCYEDEKQPGMFVVNATSYTEDGKVSAAFKRFDNDKCEGEAQSGGDLAATIANLEDVILASGETAWAVDYVFTSDRGQTRYLDFILIKDGKMYSGLPSQTERPTEVYPQSEAAKQ